MLICTRKGELHSDPAFGCEIWDLQFEQIVNQKEWKKKVVESLELGIKKYEKRIKNSSVSVILSDVEVDYHLKRYTEVKKQAQIVVNARLVHNEDLFEFSTKIFVSPLSSNGT